MASQPRAHCPHCFDTRNIDWWQNPKLGACIGFHKAHDHFDRDCKEYQRTDRVSWNRRKTNSANMKPKEQTSKVCVHELETKAFGITQPLPKSKGVGWGKEEVGRGRALAVQLGNCPTMFGRRPPTKRKSRLAAYEVLDCCKQNLQK